MDGGGREKVELVEMGRSSPSSIDQAASAATAESALQWAAVDRLPTFERLRTSLFEEADGGEKRVVDVGKLGPLETRAFVENLIKHVEDDNLRLLQKQKERMDRVNVKQPTIEVRYENLCVEAECEVVDGKPLPTLWNTVKSWFHVLKKLSGSKSEEVKISIIKDVSGIIRPSRMTLLLGPPGCGKTTLLLALAAKLDQSLKVTGEVFYNGYKVQEFVPEKTAAYISQYDLYVPEMTVRETLDFSARFQGVGKRAELMKEVLRREKEAGIIPEPDIDTYMKAISLTGLERSLQTDYVMKIVGLDICADIMVGDGMRRGISGGEKKRLTTGEMIVGPTKVLLMDEISTGLDTSTTFQIVKYLQQLAHTAQSTLLISLLQPAPETYELFDDIILMGEGEIVYHGPKSHILGFFEECGFRCPERKGTADFLQEVISMKDQEQYWYHNDQPYSYVSINHFSERFKACHVGKQLQRDVSKSYERPECQKDALSFHIYALPRWELLKACMAREILLMKRNSFVYIFKTTQLLIIACITTTVFLRTRMEVDVMHSNYYMGSLFYALILLMVNGFPELVMTVSRLPVFYKQRDFYFYPAWTYSIPATVLKIPISLIESFFWTTITYYGIGYSPTIGRFFRHFLLLFAVHNMSLSLFRFLASVFKTSVRSTTSGSVTLFACFLFGGFVLPRSYLPKWLKWGFWISPVTYAEIGLTVNEFASTRWNKISSGNTTIAHLVLTNRGLDYAGCFYWISLGALLGFALLLNLGFVLALTYSRPPGRSRAIISHKKLSQFQEKGRNDHTIVTIDSSRIIRESRKSGSFETVVLPFEPMTMSFQDVRYYVDTPMEMKKLGYAERRLQLLHDITGAFRPGILTALMGVSGAGKTTLLDVLSGRKTGGIIEGHIRIGGYPKVQETFARICGYCEQSDIHSPQLTVEESLLFSAWLRLSVDIDHTTRAKFVNEVLGIVELDGIKDSLVGIPGINGLSTEQRKRLTIAVELVSNPSIIFMDEPTSGLDARAAAIVMRAVKNVAETGRTVVCTIHQPSIDIFESFDELVLMKRGGRLIYSGLLGQHSRRVIEYFEGITGIPNIKDNYNPATWMLEVTSTSSELQLGIDFAEIYRGSMLRKYLACVSEVVEDRLPSLARSSLLIIQETVENLNLVKQLQSPPPGSKVLRFPTQYAQNSWNQFKACLWKQHLSYWRSPSYTLVRLMFMTFVSVVFAAVFWQKGKSFNNQQGLFNILGSMFLTMIFTGINNCSPVIPFVSIERNVLYRETFAGMYSSWAYAFAQMTIEILYVFLQVLVFMLVAYPAIGYSMETDKFFWFFYVMFFTLLYFNYLAILLVSLTPNVHVAAILASTFYPFVSLFSGFMVPGKQIPIWWLWLYYVCPSSWTLHGLFSSQFGDVQTEITVFGETKPISSFIRDYFGFRHDRLGLVAVMLPVYSLIFGSLFAYCIGKLNFQKR